MITQQLADIFSILHDGTITGWSGNKEKLTLKIDCEYLARIINPAYTLFYLELDSIASITLTAWLSDLSGSTIQYNNLEDIFKYELEINSVKTENGIVIINCLQHDNDSDIGGGELKMSCSEVRIYDESRQLLTIEQMDTICSSYWDDLTKRSHE